MQDGHAAGGCVRSCSRTQAHDILANLGWIDTIVAAVQRGNELGKDAPYECLLSVLVLGL